MPYVVYTKIQSLLEFAPKAPMSATPCPIENSTRIYTVDEEKSIKIHQSGG